uniref:Uncharacterized protein n=1 Tax=Entomoneis paludosa TaxID=265537 RepID=A0A7S2YT06_9STRA|mmetsp:Transcript_853/g.2040  ORF Transcript_853/g.2040 Transcript_853/m.2040 type:complete len:262 (+) Transcript_853:162-947(+)|eukprot:CAMPEP_0172467260 /NCGR_PEP_ID=MMETSP1065-20121228/58382_1 /TAXON_ID=265537 /ORGANISM="Amphiprora paludosa, Strain CCMP125" /LENGTH=261 /DNA_ID=CAMNT_0013224353 /DNA_START=151 /DNA_END=936 /DNA_ORIENTATION=+
MNTTTTDAMNSLLVDSHHQVASEEPDERTDDITERRDEGERTDESFQQPRSQYTYRLFNHSHTRQRSDGETSSSNDAIWDQLMEIHLQSSEGRDDDMGAAAMQGHVHDSQEDDAVVIHRNLLRRRHVRKIQKARTAQLAASTAAGRPLATSPMQKKSPPRELPSINTKGTSASPCSFFGDRKPSHSPIRHCGAAAVRKLGVNGMTSHLSVMTVADESTDSSNASANQKHNHSNYPEISPVRCVKRRKLFTASRTADCVIMS